MLWPNLFWCFRKVDNPKRPLSHVQLMNELLQRPQITSLLVLFLTRELNRVVPCRIYFMLLTVWILFFLSPLVWLCLYLRQAFKTFIINLAVISTDWWHRTLNSCLLRTLFKKKTVNMMNESFVNKYFNPLILHLSSRISTAQRKKNHGRFKCHPSEFFFPVASNLES